MSVTAEQLNRQTSAKCSGLERVIRENLRAIDEALQAHPGTWGRNVVCYDLPYVIVVPGLNLQDAQRVVYSTIIVNLEGRGFGVRLLLDGERNRLYVEWVSDINDEEVKNMNRILKRTRIYPDDLDGYLRPEASEGFRDTVAAVPAAALSAQADAAAFPAAALGGGGAFAPAGALPDGGGSESFRVNAAITDASDAPYAFDAPY